MANKPSVTKVNAGAQYSSTTLNDNFELIAQAIENCLGRSGTDESPNSMNKTMDMNLNKIQNLAAPNNDRDAATKKYVDDLIAAAVAGSVTIIDGSGVLVSTTPVSGYAVDWDTVSQSPYTITPDNVATLKALRPMYYHGMLGDGSTDDSDAFQAYLDYNGANGIQNVYLYGDIYLAGVVTASYPVNIYLQGRIIMEAQDNEGQLILAGKGSRLIAGIVTSNMWVAQLSAEVSVGATRLYLEDTSEIEIGDKIRSNYLWGDHDYGTVTNVTASYVDVDNPVDATQLPQYLPAGAASTLRAPAGAYVMQYSDWVSHISVEADDVTVLYTEFTNCASQGIRSIDAKNLEIAACRFHDNALESLSLATTDTSTYTTAWVHHCTFYGYTWDIAKQLLVMNGRNSRFNVSDMEINANSTDSFFYHYNRANGSSYYYSNMRIRNIKPDFMLASAGYYGADYGYTPNSIWRVIAEDAAAISAGRLFMDNVIFERQEGNSLYNAGFKVSPNGAVASGTFDEMYLNNSRIDDGFRFDGAANNPSLVRANNVFIQGEGALFWNMNAPARLELNGVIFERVDGKYTDDNANDNSFYGAQIDGDSGWCKGCSFINGTSVPATYTKAPLYYYATIRMEDTVIDGGVPTNADTSLRYNWIRTKFLNIDDDATTLINSMGVANRIEIDSINGGTIPGAFYRIATASPKLRKSGSWENTEYGMYSDWYIPIDSLFYNFEGTSKMVDKANHTTCDGGAAAAQDTITVASATGIANADYAQVLHSDGTVRRYTVSDISGAPDIVLTGNLDVSVDDGAGITFFTVA